MISLSNWEEQELVEAYEAGDEEECLRIILLGSAYADAAKIICEYLTESGWLTVPLKNYENAADMYITDAYAALEDEIVRIVKEAKNIEKERFVECGDEWSDSGRNNTAGCLSEFDVED